MSVETLRAIDGLNLPGEYRALLRPGAAETDSRGNVHRLPRFFYEIGSWQQAHEVRFAPQRHANEIVAADWLTIAVTHAAREAVHDGR